MSDFIVAGTLLFCTGITYILVIQVLASRTADNTLYQVAVGFALFAGLFLVWVNLAVGIIGSEDNPINLLYFGVIAVGIIGAFMAHFRPQGMALTMFAMAFAQTLIAAIALFNDWHQVPGSSLTKILSVNGFFITLFIISALLFRYDAQKQKPESTNMEN